MRRTIAALAFTLIASVANAETSKSNSEVVVTLGVVTTVQSFPSQCMDREEPLLPPTAHTSSGEMALMPYMSTLDVVGAGTSDHPVPSQCSKRAWL